MHIYAKIGVACRRKDSGDSAARNAGSDKNEADCTRNSLRRNCPSCAYSDSRAEVFESPAPSSKVSIGGASICKGPDGTYANINGCGALDAMTPSPQLTPPPAAPTPTPQQSPQPRRILLQNQPKCDDARLNHLVLQAWNEFWAKIIQSPIILPQYRETYIANLSPLNLQISESVSQPGSAVCRGLTAFQILATGLMNCAARFSRRRAITSCLTMVRAI